MFRELPKRRKADPNHNMYWEVTIHRPMPAAPRTNSVWMIRDNTNLSETDKERIPAGEYSPVLRVICLAKIGSKRSGTLKRRDDLLN